MKEVVQITQPMKLSPHVRYRIVDNEAVVVRQNEGDVLVLNEVAGRVLDLVAGGLSAEEIGSRLAGEYDAPESSIRNDVERFLGELRDLNIICDAEPQSGEAR